MALELPYIDPVVLQIGPVVIRWYALAYLAGFILGWKYCLWVISRRKVDGRPNSQDIDDFLVWAVIGVILGGRIGYVLFYQLHMYINEPLEALKIWHGGMSFHGGLLGVIIAMVLFARRRGIAVLRLSDLVAAAVPIGLFFGRIANFINMELMGKVTTLPWGVIFPDGYHVIRHPSQLYEAVLEGIVLFFILYVLTKREVKPGIVTGVFLICYGLFRGLVEFVRQPDAQIGLIGDFITMGQILCIPMILAGIAVYVYALRAKPAGVNDAQHA